MKSSDSRSLPYPPERVFDALTDLDILRQCIPGCERIDRGADDKLDALIAAKVGPVRAKFEVGIDITEAVRPHSYKATGEGKGAAGMASGNASANLTGENGGTRLDYEFEANIGGKIAQLGSRVIEAFSKKFAGDFFDRFEACLLEDPNTRNGAGATPPKNGPGSARGGSKTIAWGIGAVLLAVAIIYFLSR